ncbi:MAG: DUF488 family protein [Planctomycetota bacterium]|nr:DUF488 family protein [Planctomycetota bacterium]
MIQLKRAYEAPAPDDGLRILVERLWPRGVSKQKANIDLWLKDLAPSTELRKWYGHDRTRWPEFRLRYWAELSGLGDFLVLLKYVIRERTVTFVFAASDEECNSAAALREFLEV